MKSHGLFPDSIGRSAQRTRRTVLQTAAAAAGGLLLSMAARPDLILPAFAKDDYDDAMDHSGRGHGHGGDDDGQHHDDDDHQVTTTQMGQIPAGAVQVRIVSDDAGGFVPGALTVDLGQTVAFINGHSDEHTATGSGFDTGIIPEGGFATVVMDTPGRFPYACRIHPEMTGQIMVRDASGAVPSLTTQTTLPMTSDTAVSIANFAFNPDTTTVPAGGTVTWRNDDPAPHTVTADDGQFDSGILDPGASFSWTFSAPGSVSYHCQVHPSMTGSVNVS